MLSRFGNKVNVFGSVPDDEGYVTGRREGDRALRVYHLGDLRCEDDTDREWMDLASEVVSALRALTGFVESYKKQEA